MKNYTLKKIIVCLMVLTMTAGCLTACGSSEMKAAAGTYKGQYTKMVGDETKDTADSFTLTLESNGKGKHERDGLTLDNLVWELKDGEFKMTETFMGISIDYTGTLKDGVLDIFNGDPTDDWTMEYVYNKQ